MEFRHLNTYRPPRGRQHGPPLIVAAPPPPVIDWPAEAMVTRRVRAMARRARGDRWEPVYDQSAVVVVVQAERRRACMPRRGRRFDRPWNPQESGPPFPPYVPQSIRARIRPALQRRGTLWEPVWPQQTPAAPAVCPPRTVRARVKPALGRRGRIAQPPWSQQAGPPAPIYPPRWTRLKSVLLRRGRVAQPPWSQQAPAVPPAYPPQSIRVRVRPGLLRRGHVWQPPWPQQTPAPAPAFMPDRTRGRRRFAAVRRGARLAVPPQQPVPLRITRSRRPIGRVWRRGRTALAWAQAAPVAPVTRRLSIRALLARRQRLAQPAWQQVVIVGQPNRWLPAPTRPRFIRAFRVRRGRILFIPRRADVLVEIPAGDALTPRTGRPLTAATGDALTPRTGHAAEPLTGHALTPRSGTARKKGVKF